MLLELAGHATGAQLERITRAYRQSGPAATDEERRRYTSRFLRFGYDEQGCLVGTFRLPAESGALLAAAIAAAVESEAVRQADSDGARDAFAAVQADALMDLVTAGHAAVTSDVPADDDSRFLVTVVTEREILSGHGPDVDPAGECHIEDGPGLASETVRRIACDCTAVEITESPDGTVLDVGRRTRVIGRRMRRALRRRDTHCRYPGCLHKVVQGHHIQHWTDGGRTSLNNLISLCPRHHHRLHEGGYRIRHDPAGGIEFVHPNGWTIPEVFPAPDQLDSRLGWEEPGPYQDGWDGTGLDLPTIVEGLLHLEHVAHGLTADSAESDSAHVPTDDATRI